ncbi:prepilin peptidase [Ferrovum sp. PN-J185]|uniref:A24 family peptidase n=1 Tax=Ferrovum sp. PN-J185 TaxID=1356306 RepID=UPI0018D46038|nr:prepilin peptidase [Ferrovum sp. PN-J185]MCC6069135.1 prepilin peptidase [Ferrovum sp. PN-J185]MDE1890884.1 prepilin peptidase [Betaproteobacteria bacterium]MDE2055804.1 prepilin peptidase [Betaproteobacteria bacterium]
MCNNLSLLSLLVIASVFDLSQRRIPNWLILMGCGIAFFIARLNGVMTIESTLQAMGLALLLGFPLYQRGWCGAGDIKLMIMVASFVGALLFLKLVVYVLAAGGLVSAYYRLKSAHQTVPYALAITIGVMINQSISYLNGYV